MNTITVSEFRTFHLLAHERGTPIIDVVSAGSADPTVDYVAFTGVIVSARDEADHLVARKLVPARRAWRDQVGSGVVAADRAGWHDVPPAEAAIHAAIDTVALAAGIPAE